MDNFESECKLDVTKVEDGFLVKIIHIPSGKTMVRTIPNICLRDLDALFNILRKDVEADRL